MPRVGIDYRTMSSKANPSGAIWMVKTPQARDKPAHRSHQAPDIGKHNVFEAPRSLNFVKHMIWRGPGWRHGSKGGALVWGEVQQRFR